MALALKYHNLAYIITLIVLCQPRWIISQRQCDFPISSPRHSSDLSARSVRAREKQDSSVKIDFRIESTTSGHSFTGRTDVNYIAEGGGRGRVARVGGAHRKRDGTVIDVCTCLVAVCVHWGVIDRPIQSIESVAHRYFDAMKISLARHIMI